jgi:CheY-like chemotaxis protein
MDDFEIFDDLFGDHISEKSEDHNLLFSESEKTAKSGDKQVPSIESEDIWKILVIDDEEDIHNVTRIALMGFTFRDKSIEIHDAYSVQEAKDILRQHPDIAFILLDMVMKSTGGGFDLFKEIREKMETGLGFHIVDNIVKQKLNGSIECQSEFEKGTRFIITIPLKK